MICLQHDEEVRVRGDSLRKHTYRFSNATRVPKPKPNQTWSPPQVLQVHAVLNVVRLLQRHPAESADIASSATHAIAAAGNAYVGPTFASIT